jgi:tRNA wybutosine-synthesizing protein 3
MDFQTQKSTFLKKIDKSKKKTVDKEIIPLISSINKNQNYYTTSSCSGRIVILEKKSEKRQNKWLFITHKTTTFKQVKASLKTIPKEELWFRQEPLILHVCCKTIEDAKNLLNIARNVFKRAGIISINKRIIVEIIGTDALYTILARNKRLLVDDSYLKQLIKEANKKMTTNKNKINKFHKLIRTISYTK